MAQLKWIPREQADNVDLILLEEVRFKTVAGERTQNDVRVPIGDHKVKKAREHLEGLLKLRDKGLVEDDFEIQIKSLQEFLAPS